LESQKKKKARNPGGSMRNTARNPGEINEKYTTLQPGGAEIKCNGPMLIV
jgi:hypothetical protein